MKLDDAIKRMFEDIAKSMNIPHTVMNSGAGHDAMRFWDIAPTGLLLIPCKDGISHNIDEAMEYEDLILGSRLIFALIKKLANIA